MIQSIDRAFQILELLNTLECSESEISGYDISKRLGLKYPTVHNFLKTLLTLGYIEQHPASGKYLLSVKMQNLGCHRSGQKSLINCAQPCLRQLTEMIGETSLLVLFADDYRHTVLVEETDKPFRITAATDLDQNFYNTSTGRVLLANLEPAEYSRFKKRVPINFGKRHVPDRETEMDLLLDKIRKRGYECLDKVEGNVTVMAVPLLHRAAGLNASIGTYFYCRSKSKKEINAILAAMQKTSSTLTRIIGINQPAKEGK